MHQVTALSYIQAEFCEAHVEEADPFDEAFDQLAKESKDPFDTSAYAHITKELEDDLEFEALAKRDPHEVLSCSADIGESA